MCLHALGLSGYFTRCVTILIHAQPVFNVKMMLMKYKQATTCGALCGELEKKSASICAIAHEFAVGNDV